VTFFQKLIAERQNATGGDPSEIFIKPQSSSIIDGNFLSIAFGGLFNILKIFFLYINYVLGALLVIISVSIYAFYNLYHAVLKKFPSKHTEL
jgi:hypothetical protein